MTGVFYRNLGYIHKPQLCAVAMGGKTKTMTLGMHPEKLPPSISLYFVCSEIPRNLSMSQNTPKRHPLKSITSKYSCPGDQDLTS